MWVLWQIVSLFRDNIYIYIYVRIFFLFYYCSGKGVDELVANLPIIFVRVKILVKLLFFVHKYQVGPLVFLSLNLVSIFSKIYAIWFFLSLNLLKRRKNFSSKLKLKLYQLDKKNQTILIHNFNFDVMTMAWVNKFNEKNDIIAYFFQKSRSN